jgi:hypothetical protein
MYILQDLLLIHDVQDRQADRGGNRVAPKGVEVMELA